MKRMAVGFMVGALAFVALSAARAEGAASPPSPSPAYAPGLGDIMGAIQMRHAKLWFAGKNANWGLAAYEVDEIKEGFATAAKFQPEFKGRPVAQLVDEITQQPLKALDKAVDARNAAMFSAAFDQLTQACNACHRTTNFGFIAITRPSRPPFANQRFAPIKGGG